MKIGDKIILNNNGYVSERNKNKIWKIRFKPRNCYGKTIILFLTKNDGYAVDGVFKEEL